MAPRAYAIHTRRQQQLALKANIAAVAAQLHATQGVLNTTYAQIAKCAGVAIPTVYKHFPSLDELVRGCTAHVVRQAPEFPAEHILAAPDIESAVQRLVVALDRLNAYFEPWVTWREQDRLPALAEMAAHRRMELTALCAAVLKRHGAHSALRDAPSIWEALIHFECWQRLVREHKLSRTAVRRTLVHLLLAVAGPQPAAPPTPRPQPRK